MINITFHPHETLTMYQASCKESALHSMSQYVFLAAMLEICLVITRLQMKKQTEKNSITW